MTLRKCLFLYLCQKKMLIHRSSSRGRQSSCAQSSVSTASRSKWRVSVPSRRGRRTTQETEGGASTSLQLNWVLTSSPGFWPAHLGSDQRLVKLSSLTFQEFVTLLTCITHGLLPLVLFTWFQPLQVLFTCNSWTFVQLIFTSLVFIQHPRTVILWNVYFCCYNGHVWTFKGFLNLATSPWKTNKIKKPPPIVQIWNVK